MLTPPHSVAKLQPAGSSSQAPFPVHTHTQSTWVRGAKRKSSTSSRRWLQLTSYVVVCLFIFKNLARNAKQAILVTVVQVPPLHISFFSPLPLCSHCHWSLLLPTAVSTLAHQEQMGQHQPVSLQTCSWLPESNNSPSPLLNLCLQSRSNLWPRTLLAVLSYLLLSCRVVGGFLSDLNALGWVGALVHCTVSRVVLELFSVL